MKKNNILFIGAGRMAEAIYAGLLRQSHPDIGRIIVSNKSDEERLHNQAKQYGVKQTTKWKEETDQVEVIVLAAPPGVHDELLKELAEVVDGQLVITVAAGIDPDYMEKRLPEGTPVAWIMPNTAAQVQQSMSTYVCGQYVNSEHRHVLEVILHAIGEYEELSAQQVHDLTAVTGSAPAFMYLFCEALETAAMEYGVTREQARKLVVQMAAGSAAMLQEGHNPADLRGQVTSPGGATAAGIETLKEAGFEELIKNAVQATNQRAKDQAED
ncbi:pyrroline-5-carboxylate reductase [Thalassorhabdus alkalitolerans]|uniref:Pyrroline-5-carboxylate reductase n=1 Tax=Thalassorhabdus alkalitolerans TaxID=2282697 RepID=A0ABW0YPL2_9BACI